jgi:hypothetical protein
MNVQVQHSISKRDVLFELVARHQTHFEAICELLREHQTHFEANGELLLELTRSTAKRGIAEDETNRMLVKAATTHFC